MKILGEPLPGVFLLEPRVFADARGDFVKTFHAGQFAELGISFAPVEEFFSTSKRNVLRGMHFQVPPHDHAKLVYAVRGRVLDVLVDLRRSSPAYGKAVSAELSAANHHQFFIPSGIAHGFLALEDDSVLVYKTSTVHAPAHDTGIGWDSFGFAWPGNDFLISPRDAAQTPLSEFQTPFP